MTDLEIIEKAARENGQNIRRSVWMDEGPRMFLGNAFLAFADEIKKLREDAAKAKKDGVCTNMVPLPGPEH